MGRNFFSAAPKMVCSSRFCPWLFPNSLVPAKQADLGQTCVLPTDIVKCFTESGNKNRECVRAGAAGARTRKSLGHHLLHPLILRLLVICAPAGLRPRALQDAPAPADPNS